MGCSLLVCHLYQYVRRDAGQIEIGPISEDDFFPWEALIVVLKTHHLCVPNPHADEGVVD
jgi:hypothetical protein